MAIEPISCKQRDDSQVKTNQLESNYGPWMVVTRKKNSNRLVEVVGPIIQTKVILLFPRISQSFWKLIVRVMKVSFLGYLSLEKRRTQQ